MFFFFVKQKEEIDKHSKKNNEKQELTIPSQYVRTSEAHSTFE